jgi:hypothetical protein
MKITSTSESNLDPHAQGVFADISNLMASVPKQHSEKNRTSGDPAIDLPSFGGTSFVDLNPWSRGGINE